MATSQVKTIYSKIQNLLFYMIPENWDRIYLYASVYDHLGKLQTGEMFFYYFPKGILKKNPVNIYEIPERFHLEEEAYLQLADDLYDTIKELKNELKTMRWAPLDTYYNKTRKL